MLDFYKIENKLFSAEIFFLKTINKTSYELKLQEFLYLPISQKPNSIFLVSVV
jgi:hypothetical protein